VALRIRKREQFTLTIKTGFLGYFAYVAFVYDEAYGKRYKRIEVGAQEIVKEEEEVMIKEHEAATLGYQDLPIAEERVRKREEVNNNHVLRQKMVAELKEMQKRGDPPVGLVPTPRLKTRQELDPEVYQPFGKELESFPIETTDSGSVFPPPDEPKPDYVPEADINLLRR